MQNMFLSVIMLLSMSFPSKRLETYKPVVVLELFTSQGCSSCPKADELLQEVRNGGKEANANVIALSYHVDYWNYIGWKDPFSKKVFSDKQRAYSSKFFSSSIYTPQIVVNGVEHFVGSDREIMQTRLDTYLKMRSKNKVTISNIEKDQSKINFDYKIFGTKDNKKIRAILVINDRVTSVKRGENSNRTLKNSNIVVAENYLNTTDEEGVISIPEIVSENDKLTLILVVETNDLNVTGASQIKVN